MAAPDRKVDVQRVLSKVQQDPTGALLVQNAMLACVVEDQEEQIGQLQSALADKVESEERDNDGSL